jgi:hypothetical protein
VSVRDHLNTPFLLVLLGGAATADAQVQPQVAQRYFEEATKLCERDGGRLWGVRFVDKTGTINCGFACHTRVAAKDYIFTAYGKR